MILSDKSITELCVIPDRYVDPLKFKALETAALVSYAHALENGMDGVLPLRPDYDQIRARASRPWSKDEIQAFRPMIDPFIPKQVRKLMAWEGGIPIDYMGKTHTLPARQIAEFPIISRGLTSYGYDVALGPKFKVFTNINSAVIDPKRIDPKCFVDVEAKFDHETGESFVLMPPNSYLLGSTIETFDIPRDVMVICLGKSTYARSGGIVNVTPIEAGFKGSVVIEISNSTNLPARVYANEGIAQFLFLRGDQSCEVSYADRDGKYQGQTGLTLPKV